MNQGAAQPAGTRKQRMIGASATLAGRPGIDRPIRVLHCPTDVGGNPQCLAQMERELGAHSISIVFKPSCFQYESDQILFDCGDRFVRRGIKVWSLILRAIRDFDLIHYNFGRPLILYSPEKRHMWPPHQAVQSLLSRSYFPLFEFADVALLKRAGKGIFVTYQGDDARQGDYCRANHEVTNVDEVDYHSPEMDLRKRLRIAKFNRYADRTYALNPDLLSVLPSAEFLPYASVEPLRWEPVYPEPRERPLVLHAPTHRNAKGTRFLIEAADRLQREGVLFDLELVENLPHVEAKKRYQAADIVVDQLLAGWYGGFAVEAMGLGKPVIAYLRASDLHFLPHEMRAAIPIINATPTTIYEVLKEWLTVRRRELSRRGRAGRSYVENWHDARTIAKRLIADYVGILRNRCSR